TMAEIERVAPVHDTGSKLYTLGSFLLPPVGLGAHFLFKHFKHFKNAKACLKGALAGFAVPVALAIILAILILIALI
ncbi:MAG: hypothetical protein IKU90_00055, partial [Clostridia bacterium]|nr:hypothetical protein [Clostridia bacterium]